MSNKLKDLSIPQLKIRLHYYYDILKTIDNYEDERVVDSVIHEIKKVLESRGIYVRERIEPVFVNIK